MKIGDKEINIFNKVYEMARRRTRKDIIYKLDKPFWDICARYYMLGATDAFEVTIKEKQ